MSEPLRDRPAERARRAVRELAPPEPEPAFRAWLERAFVTGDFPAPVAVRRRPWWRGEPVRWLLAPALAVALLVGAGLLNQGPRWQVIATSGQGMVVVDGRPVPMNHLEELERLTRPGARIQVPEDGQLEIVSRGTMAIQLAPGTDMTVPSPPGRWLARAVQGEVRAGELRIATGRRFRGARLHLTTVEAQVEVRGTTLAVICDPDGTCVCVLEGTVRVGRREGRMVPVHEGRLRFVYNDARPPRLAPMRPVEHEALSAFRAERRADLQ